MISIYLATFVGFSDLLLIPVILVLSGLALSIWIRGKAQQDPDISASEFKDTLYFTLIALAGIGLGSLLIPGLFRPPQLPLELSIFDQMLYGTLFAVSEERFFRGFITPFLMWKLGMPMPANLGSGAIFSIYHFNVYGSSPDKLIYVFIAGAILSYVTLKSGRIVPAKLAHIANNVFAR